MSSSSQSSPLEPAGDPGASSKSSFRKKRPKIPPVAPADTNQGLTNQLSGGYALPRSYRPVVVTRKRDPLEQQQQQHRQQLQRRRRQQLLRGKNAASSSSTTSSGDDRSVGTFSTTYTQTSRVSDVSISTFDPILHQDDPFYMDVQQKIAKSLRPSKTPVDCFDLEHEKSEEKDQDGLGHFLHHQLDAEERQESVKMLLDVENVVEIEDVDNEEVDRQMQGEPSFPFRPKYSLTIDPDDDWIHPDTLEIPDIVRNVKGDTDFSPKRNFLYRNRYAILGLSLLAVIGIVIGVVIPTTMSSSASAPQPSPAPTSLEDVVRDTLQEKLNQASSSVIPSYELPSTTLDWLVQYYSRNSTLPSVTEPLHSEETLLQLAALVSIYGSTVGANWTLQDSWLSFEVGICKWWGVVCDDSGRFVTALELYSNGLQGTIPLEIGFLTNLVSLELHENALNGTLPSSLSYLTALQELTLNNNVLTGQLPLSLPPNLTVLDVEYNSLAGTLSEDLLQSKLLSLERLGLGGNGFWGSVPTSLGGLTNLTTLSLHDNAFTGNLETMNLEVLTSLQYIWISNNKLTGTVPEFLGNMPDLRWLLFEENALGGSIPSRFGDLRRVQRMDFSNTGLTGTLPPTLSNWRYIEYLNVAQNNMIGTIPTDYGFMTSLQYVDLSQNAFTGTLPTELDLWVTLLGMDVSSNALVGTMPEGLCSRSPPPDMSADCGSSGVGFVCACCSICL